MFVSPLPLFPSSASMFSSLLAASKQFVADVQFTVNAVLEDEKKEYAAEQEKVAAKQREQAAEQERLNKGAVPLWTIWQPEKRHLEPDLQKKLLKLSKDRRTFLAPTPDHTAFPFTLSSAQPFALSALRLDVSLERARFLLVPRKMSEEGFWRAYFYRVENTREQMKVEAILRIPEEEAIKRQQEIKSKLGAAAVALPASAVSKPVSSSTTTASSSTKPVAHKDDDDDIDHELNQYLNEVLSDEDENDEPNIDDATSSTTVAASSTSVLLPIAPTTHLGDTVPASAIPQSVAATGVAAPVMTNSAPVEPSKPAASAAPATLASLSVPTVAPGTATTTTITTAIVTPSTATKPAAVAQSADSAKPQATVAAGLSTVSAPVTASIPAARPTVSQAPPKPAAVSVPAPSVAAVPAAASPLDDNDEEDLAELENMLQDVGLSTKSSSTRVIATQAHDDLDDARLAELENELDTP